MNIEVPTEVPERCPMKILTGCLMMVLLTAWESKSILIQILSVFLITHPSPSQSFFLSHSCHLLFLSQAIISFLYTFFLLSHHCRSTFTLPLRCWADEMQSARLHLPCASWSVSTDIGCRRLKLGFLSSQASSHCWKHMESECRVRAPQALDGSPQGKAQNGMGSRAENKSGALREGKLWHL